MVDQLTDRLPLKWGLKRFLRMNSDAKQSARSLDLEIETELENVMKGVKTMINVTYTQSLAAKTLKL